MPWRRPAGLGLAALLLAIWSLYVRRRAIEARCAVARERESEKLRDPGKAA